MADGQGGGDGGGEGGWNEEVHGVWHGWEGGKGGWSAEERGAWGGEEGGWSAEEGGSDGGEEGGWSAEEEAMRSKIQAREEALAADRARQEAADRAQRGSLEAARRLQRSVEELRAAAREKDAEMDRLRAEATDARKKLQADASKMGRWEAAYLDLLLGANQKLVELRDADMDDSRALEETPNSKELEGCTKLNQNTVDHIASDLSAELRKLKHAYETLSSKKDKEVSALLSEKDSVSNQLSIMQQDYTNKKAEAAQGTEAALKLQQSVDELNVLAQKKDDEIGRLQADAVEAKRNLQKMQSLVKEKDDEIGRLQADAVEAKRNLQKMQSLVKEKDDEIGRLQADAVEAKMNLQKMQSLVKEKVDEIQRLKGQHPESIQKCNKDISEACTNFRSDDPAVKSKSKNSDLVHIVEDYISQTGTIGKDWQDEPRQKRRRVTFILNDDEQSGSDEDDDGQSSHDELDEDEQGGCNGETMNNPVQKPLGTPERKIDACNARFANGKATVKAMVRSQWYWYDMAPAPLCSQKLQILNGQRFVTTTGNWARYVRDVKVIFADQPDKHKEFVEFLCNFENWRIEDVARTMAVLLDGHPELICRFNRFLPKYWQIEIEAGEEHHPDESAAAAASLIKLKEAEQQPNQEQA
uniref:Uncharacterized protein n=1 Tax=Avena sativa TaxID=4498 RepID=A0ACD5TBK2_AVESA